MFALHEQFISQYILSRLVVVVWDLCLGFKINVQKLNVFNSITCKINLKVKLHLQEEFSVICVWLYNWLCLKICIISDRHPSSYRTKNVFNKCFQLIDTNVLPYKLSSFLGLSWKWTSWIPKGVFPRGKVKTIILMFMQFGLQWCDSHTDLVIFKWTWKYFFRPSQYFMVSV